jgi:hypothetical protein
MNARTAGVHVLGFGDEKTVSGCVQVIGSFGRSSSLMPVEAEYQRNKRGTRMYCGSCSRTWDVFFDESDDFFRYEGCFSFR